MHMSGARRRSSQSGEQDKPKGTMDKIKSRVEEATGAVSGGDRTEGTEGRDDRFRGLGEAYSGYQVYDRNHEKIGKVDYLFVDENDQPEYIGVKTGLLGTKSTLIPMEMARVNDQRKLVEVAAEKDKIKDAPAFDAEQEITPEHEARTYRHFGLERRGSTGVRGGYGEYYSSGVTRGGSPEYPETREEGTPSRSSAGSYGGPTAGVGREGEGWSLEGREAPRGASSEEGSYRHAERDPGAVDTEYGERRTDRESGRGRSDIAAAAEERFGTIGGEAGHEGPATYSSEPEGRQTFRRVDGASSGDREREGFVEHPSEGRTEQSSGSLGDAGGPALRRSDEGSASGLHEQEPRGTRVRKRIRTDREQVRVPIKREEVRVEQDPSGEMRIRKEVVEDEETIEVDLQREQVDLGGGEEDVRR
jgi:stress response protein YsnF